jgi:glycosyltransferase involved in cell wall biosynthesis
LGGYELVWESAVRSLREAGHEARVLAGDHRAAGVADDADGGEVFRELRWYWRDHRFPRMGPLARLRLERHNAGVLDRHLGEWRPDAVAWWSMGGMSLSPIARVARAGVPAAAFVHDDWLVYGPKVDGWLRLTGGRQRLDLRGVRRWAFVSESTRERALGAVGGLGETEVLPSGIDPSFLDPAPEREWGWRLLYAGRLDERKGVGTAVEALARLPRSARLTLVGAGDEAYERRLRDRVRELGLYERVAFMGACGRDELRAAYAEADAVVFPVVWEEPWGLVPLEAMGRGRPVVATGRGGSGEYLRDGENCLLFEPGDPDALAAAVERLARDAELCARLRAGGLTTAREHTEERFNARVVEILEQIAS